MQMSNYYTEINFKDALILTKNINKQDRIDVLNVLVLIFSLILRNITSCYIPH